MWSLLQSIETALNTIPEFESVAIGAEMGINSRHCPAARIVTEYQEPTPKNPYYDQGAIEIILLMDLKNDLPSVYEDSISISTKIRIALKGIVTFNRIDFDRDSVSSMKVSILRFTFSGIRNDKEECPQ